MTGTFIETYGGAHFDFAQPRPAEVHIEDIARALSFTCRFSGHTRIYMSVAEHALLVRHLVRQVDPGLGFAALHHDSHEAYVGDVPTPLKNLLGHAYREITGRVDAAVAKALDINPAHFHDPLVRWADQQALRIEAGILQRSGGAAIAEALDLGPAPAHPGKGTPGLQPHQAERQFLDAHYAEANGR